MATERKRTSSSTNYSKPKKASSTSGKRKTTQSNSSRAAKTTSTTSRKKTTRTNQVSTETKEEILIFLLFVFFVFVLLCMINVIKGFLGEGVKTLMLGIFGVIGYIIPLALLVAFMFKLANRDNVIASIKILSAILLLCIIGVLICQISTLNVSNVADSTTMIKDLYESQEKGGIIFGLLAVGLFKAFGNAGTWFVCIILGIIAILLLTEKNFLKQMFYNHISAPTNYDIDDDETEYYQYKLEDKISASREKEPDQSIFKQLTLEDKKTDKEKEELKHQKEQEKEAYKKQKEDEKQKLIEEKQKALEQKELIKDMKDDERILNTTIKGPTSIYDNIGLDMSTPLIEQKRSISKDELHEITLSDLGIDAKNVSDNNFEPNDIEKSNDNIAQEEIIELSTINSTIDVLNSDDDDFLNELNLEKKIIENVDNDQTNIDNNSIDNNQIIEKIYNNSNPQIVDSNNVQIFENKFESEILSDDVSSMPEPVTEKSHEGNEKPDEKPKAKPKAYKFPSFNLLHINKKKSSGDSDEELKTTALKLQNTLKTFGVGVKVSDISQGPSVTRYELTLDEGTKVSKIVSLQDDIKLNLAAQDIRIEAPIPGKAAVGIEIPNKETSPVLIRDLLETKEFDQAESKITFAVGKDISGKTIVADIAKMPHMLIAGATGAGKSVCINTLIMSILYKADPKDVKLIMIDPKVVELSVYNGIPHLLLPVVTDPRKASASLQWAVNEMTKRYNAFATHNVRDLKGFNQKIAKQNAQGDMSELPKPNIVVIVDELADLMMVASKEVEESICRLAQLARAAGIHLIIATQRPSVDVITGLIKANMPSRVAFKVSSGVDSRTILDSVGAEKLLGKGDMLFYPQGYSKPVRVQGAFVSDEEVSDVVEFLKNNTDGESYDQEIEQQISGLSNGGSSNISGSAADSTADFDPYFKEACELVIEKEKASSGMLQRVFKIGFNRAARIIDQMESLGVVGPEEGTKPRKVLMSISEFEDLLETLY